jgi:cell division protein FtsB
MKAINAILLPTALGGVILYFSYHALAGDHALKEQLATLEAERDSLERSLGRLREATLDLDYVEELARTKLSFARPDEILIAVR